MTPRLTVVLPLKGRYLFTLRFLWHANKTRLPYRFLIADGQVHPALARLLENPREIFPELDIEYIRYPDDSDLSRFFAKMADVLQRVRTPYAMLACNDDFLGVGGVERALDFLETHTDYVCASGRIGGFSVYSGINNRSGGLTGSLNRLYMYYRRDEISSPSIAERLRSGALALWPYYSVYRTETLATIRREIAAIDFSDLILHETFQVMRALTFGKAHMDGTAISYFRQFGTSTSAGTNRNWARHLVRSQFTSNVQAMVKSIASAGTAANGCDAAEMTEIVLAALEAKFGQFLQANYGSLQEIKKVLRDRVPRLVTWVLNRPRFFIGRERSAILRELTEAGSSDDAVAQFRAELVALEDVVAGDVFLDFVRPFMSVLDPAKEIKSDGSLVPRLTT